MSLDDRNDAGVDREIKDAGIDGQVRRLAGIGALRRLRRLVDGENAAERERQRFVTLVVRIAAGVLLALGVAGLLLEIARGQNGGSGFRLVVGGVLALGALLLAVTLFARRR